ncbi:MAG: replication-associated recombination protein A [Ilumatobacteraceae bacterium]
MADDLFSAAAEERLRHQAPLAARLRPRNLDEVVGQRHLVGPGRPLRRLVEQDRLTSAIFWGPPGTGKTTLAEVVARTTNRAFERLSAVTAGVKDVREVIERARQRLGERGTGTILFLDEIHRFSKSQQDALLPAVEDGTLTLIGATTENPFFEVNPPLRSRSTLFRLEPLDREAIEALVRRGLRAEGSAGSEDAIAHLVDRAGGDGRQVLTALEVAIALAKPSEVTADHVDAALGTSALRYGRTTTTTSSGLHQVDPGERSRRRDLLVGPHVGGSGEDARFIARRLVILASEDVGLADPSALPVAVAAASAVEHVGLPEAQLNLAQAVIHLAAAPKSNRAAVAIWTARTDVQQGKLGEVPPHLKDAHYSGAGSLGHGVGYECLATTPVGGCPSGTCPSRSGTGATTNPPSTGSSRRSRSG